MNTEILEGGTWDPLVSVTIGDTRLLLDGVSGPPMLDPAGRQPVPPEYGDFDWVIFGQPRQDSLALLNGPLAETPTLVGPETGRLLACFARYAGQPRPELRLGFRPGHRVLLDGVQITPVVGQTLGGDGCAFLLRGEGQTALHVGGRLLNKEQLIQIWGQAGGPLDLLIIGEACPVGMDDLQWDLHRVMSSPGTVFVVASPLDYPLIQAAAQAARETGRAVWEDRFQRHVRRRPSLGAVFDQQDLKTAAEIADSPGRKVLFIRPSMLPFLAAYLDAGQEEPPVVYAPSRGRGLPDAALLDFCFRRGIKFHARTGYTPARDHLELAETILRPCSTLLLPAELPSAVQSFRRLEKEPDALLLELIRRTNPRVLLIALKGADKHTVRRFFSLLGQELAGKLSQKIDAMMTVRVKDVANCQWLLLELADLLRGTSAADPKGGSERKFCAEQSLGHCAITAPRWPCREMGEALYTGWVPYRGPDKPEKQEQEAHK